MTTCNSAYIFNLSDEALYYNVCECFQVAKKHRYKFSVIVHELRTAELVSYKTILIAFINCILVATEDLEDRVRLRNQFIGANSLVAFGRVSFSHNIIFAKNKSDNIQCDTSSYLV